MLLVTETQVNKIMTGKAFTKICRNNIKKGKFSILKTMWDEFGLSHAEMIRFVLGEIEFVGDTITDGLKLVDTRKRDTKFIHYLLINKFSRLVLCQQSYDKIISENAELNIISDISYDDLVRCFYKEIITYCEYKVYDKDYIVTNRDAMYELLYNGVILKTGEFIRCDGYGHDSLYAQLKVMNLIKIKDTINETTLIKVSSGQLCGDLAWKIEESYFLKEFIATKEQLQFLFNNRKYLVFYGSYENVLSPMMKYISNSLKKGTKYGNLMFLKTYYPHINLPKFSADANDLADVSKLFIRTSPTDSIPGLLNSVIVDNDSNSINQCIISMENEFEKFKNVRHNNTFNYFFQEVLEGINGVANVNKIDNAYEICYSMSETMGDIVLGKKGNVKLSTKKKNELCKLLESLYDDFKQKIQLEFVYVPKEDKLYVVQLRLINNTPYYSRHEIDLPIDKYVIKGKTFTKGDLENLSASDILIVDKDCKSEALLGKKVLIVKNDVSFSHILALSSVLDIPSIYATGEFVLESDKLYNFHALGTTGYIKNQL